MELPISYVQVLLVFAVALVLVLVQILLKRNRWNHGTELQRLLANGNTGNDELYNDYLVPLLLYEEDYPSFVDVIGLVLHRFPLEHFLKEQEFARALTCLKDSVFQPSSRQTKVSAMCAVVHGLVSDPDVEYLCRDRMHVLVEQFLDEIGDQQSSSKGNDTGAGKSVV